jgi:small-conductance mechanosensitive channel
MLEMFLRQTYCQNTVSSYLTALGIFLGYALVIYLAKILVIRRLKVWADKTETTFDDFIILHIDKTLIPLLLFGALTLSIKNLIINAAAARAVSVAGMILMVAMGLKFAMSLVDYGLTVSWKKNGDGEARRQSLKGIVIAAKVILSGIALILLMDNMGIKISALVAGLGIGGVAVAFASQAVLGDLFSFFVILFDRPFEIGDFIVVDNLMGTVEHVGIKTTRLRSIGGEQLIFSNTTLTNARVQNFKRMAQRRVVFTLGVTYQTPSQQMKEIPENIKKIITGIKGTNFDRAHFTSYGDSALMFEVVYYVLTSDYNRYMDIQQEINLKIKEEFEQRKIEFAYPTQTLFISK